LHGGSSPVFADIVVELGKQLACAAFPDFAALQGWNEWRRTACLLLVACGTEDNCLSDVFNLQP
jgi:hypothetical protein